MAVTHVDLLLRLPELDLDGQNLRGIFAQKLLKLERVKSGAELSQVKVGSRAAASKNPKSSMAELDKKRRKCLASESNSKPAGTISEGQFTSFQNVAHDFTDGIFL